MSHFISGVDCEGPLLFKPTPPQIIKPKMKRFLKINHIESMFTPKKEAKIINLICDRYSQIESQKSRAENEIFFNTKLQALKKKFTSSFNVQAGGRTVEDFFPDHNLSLKQHFRKYPMNLKDLAYKMPKRLELQRKYNSNINIKMITIQQAEEIASQKQHYRHWLNEMNNCTNSPNLNKMNFLFEKLMKKRNKLKTEGSQNGQYQDLPLDSLSSQKKSFKLDSLLKDNKNACCYTKKHKKPFTGLGKLRDRQSMDESSLYQY